MESAIMPGVDRSRQAEFISTQLLARSGLLARLLAKQLRGPLSRSEASLLNTASGTPRRITELAELEGLAQPTMTLLVKRLEQNGLVTRERQADDGRVVVVRLTEAGQAALEDYRAQASAALGKYLAEMPDSQIEQLAAATKALARLVTILQQGTVT
jgi:DNA-binding MarR family transcriptional regulator